VQHLVGEQRNEGQPIHREQREDGDRDQQHPHDRMPACVRGALGDPLEPFLLVALLQDRGQISHRQQRAHGRQVAHRIGEEADRHACRGDDQARDRRPDDGRSVEHGRVESDRVHEVLPPNHLDEEGLARREVEKVDGAGSGRRDEDHPVLGVAACRQREQRERRQREQRLCDQKDVPFAITVRDHASELAAEQNRGKLRGEDEADEEAAVRQLQRQPRHGDALHPCPDRRDDLAGQEEPVVSVAERSQRLPTRPARLRDLAVAQILSARPGETLDNSSAWSGGLR